MLKRIRKMGMVLSTRITLSTVVTDLHCMTMATLLFNVMLCHGYTPDGFNMASIYLLVKDKRKSCSDSSNYRAIALSSPLAKVLDWVLLQQQIDKFQTSELQYGFKPTSSATQLPFHC